MSEIREAAQSPPEHRDQEHLPTRNNAAAESFFSTLEHEVLSRHHFTTRAEARAAVTAWCYEFYNTRRRHSSASLLPPTEYEKIAADQPAAA
jgi:transposase InsO family protein